MAFTKKKSGSEKRKRSPIVGFRATDEERAQIEAAAARVGLTVSSYARSRALSNPSTRAVRRAPVETAQLAQLLGLLGAAGGTIKRVAEGEGALCTSQDELQYALADFRAAASAIMQALGKRPHDH